jgi:hypothetical protein
MCPKRGVIRARKEWLPSDGLAVGPTKSKSPLPALGTVRDGQERRHLQTFSFQLLHFVAA